jgi:hypothetical protein
MSPLAQHFAEAVHVLISDGPVKQRLATAYGKHLADVSEAELPAGLRRDFADLQAAMNRNAPAGTETRARASAQKMAAAEAVGHAATIVGLYLEIMNTLERAEPLKVVAPPRQPPRYLTGRS